MDKLSWNAANESWNNICVPIFYLSILTVTPRCMSEPAIDGNHVRDVVTIPSKSIIFLNALIKTMHAQERAATPCGHEYYENN